jgi:hypothetical protein
MVLNGLLHDRRYLKIISLFGDAKELKQMVFGVNTINLLFMVLMLKLEKQ